MIIGPPCFVFQEPAVVGVVGDLKILVDERAPPRRHVVAVGLTVPDDVACAVDIDGGAENETTACRKASTPGR